MRAVLKELLPKLNGNCLTVTGHTIEENVKDAVCYNRKVIYTLKDPVMKEPGIGVFMAIWPRRLHYQDGGVPSQLTTFRGPAKVFDSLKTG